MILGQLRKFGQCASLDSKLEVCLLVVITTILCYSSSKSTVKASLEPPPRSTIPLDDLFDIEDEKYNYTPSKSSNKLHNISRGLRQLIDQDETVHLNWSGDFVVKFSKYRSKHEDGMQLMRPDRLVQANNLNETDDECGKSTWSGRGWELDRLNNKTAGSTSQHNGNKRIFNGQNAAQGQFPWVAELKFFIGTFNKQLCTGTIISEWIILTASHCVFECLNKQQPKLIDPNWISALVGRSYINWWQLNIERADVQFRAIVSPTQYDPCLENNRVDLDMVLLIATQPMKLRSKQWPRSDLQRICLPKSDEEPLRGRMGVMTGWGETRLQGGRSYNLIWTTLTIDLGEKCSYELLADRDLRVLCATGSTSGGCRGDSGAPLMIQDPDGTWTQYGVYSAYSSLGGHCSPVIKMLFDRIPAWLRETIETRTIDDIINTKPQFLGPSR